MVRLKKTIKDTGRALLGVLDYLWILLCFRPAKPNSSEDLLVVRTDGIGDLLLWLDTGRALRGLYPGKRTVLLCTGAGAALARCSGYFDETIVVDVRKIYRPFYKLRIVRNLRARTFHAAILPVYSRASYMDVLTLLCAAGSRIAIDGDSLNEADWFRRAANRRFDMVVDTGRDTVFEGIRNARFVRGLGAADYRYAPVGLPPRPEQIAGFPLPDEYFILFPGGNMPQKRWPPERFAALAERLCRETGWRAVICGSADERQIGDRIAGYPGLEDAVNCCGETNLVQLAEVFRDAKLAVCNDTSGVHLAAAMRIPVVCFVYQWSIGRFLPYAAEDGNEDGLPVCLTQKDGCPGCRLKDRFTVNPRCEEGTTYQCVAGISASQAYDACMELIRKGERPL